VFYVLVPSLELLNECVTFTSKHNMNVKQEGTREWERSRKALVDKVWKWATE
jgi:hypothetical protein